jgi:hypothetical protein
MRNKQEKNMLKTKIKILLLGFIISTIVIIASTPLHEAGHWIMSDIDPYIEPIEYHVFDEYSLKNGDNALSSALGCVVIQEKYPGALKERPEYFNIIQEIICIMIQIILAVIITVKTFQYLLKKGILIELTV